MNLKPTVKSGIGAAATIVAAAGFQSAYAQTGTGITYSSSVAATPATIRGVGVSGTSGSTTITTAGVTTGGTNSPGVPGTLTLSTLTLSTSGDLTDFSNVPFNLAVTLTDSKNSQSLTQTETVTFASGTRADGTGNTAVFPLPSFSGPLTFAFNSGTVNLNSFTFNPPPSGGGTGGQIGAALSSGAAAPEPGALALAIPGLLGIVGLVRRRKSA